MKSPPVAILVSALASGVVVLPVWAQNIDEMVKWTSAQAIHYDVVGEYAGVTAFLFPQASGSSPICPCRAAVTERYEVAFDGNPGEMALVGKPVRKIFPSALPKGTPGVSVFGQPCPPPKINGAYDHVEAVGVKTGRRAATASR